MNEALTSELILPAIALAVLAAIVPSLWARHLPEGVRPLMLNAFLSTISMGVLAAAFFVALYLRQGVPVSVLFDAGVSAGIWHFLRLSLTSALLWLPILIFSLSRLPRHWKNEVW